MIELRQSTVAVVSFGPVLLNTDGVSLVVNLVGTGSNQTENTSTGIRISKNGAAFIARSATATASVYDAFGNYRVTLSTTDTNTLGTLRMQFANSAAFCPVWDDYAVITQQAWDAKYGATFLKVDVAQWLTATAPALTGDPYAAAVATTAALAAFPLKRNTASQHVPFYMRDASNPTVGFAGTPTITRSLDGAAYGAITGGTVTDFGGGFIDYSPSAADCNGVLVRYKATLTGAVTVDLPIYTHV